MKLNPDARLPAIPIQVVHRSEGKGSSYIFSDFLSKVSPEFLARAGRSESPKWTVGISAARSQDMTDKVRSLSGAIGYTELNLAEKASTHIARVRNSAGEFVKPTSRSVAAAALGAKVPGDFRISLTNAPGKESYPISSFTWFYVPSRAREAQRGKAVADFLKWVYTDGQRIAEDQGYATLPPELLTKVSHAVDTVH
jgi:phosphate transport system substrate-binding protein